MTVFGISLSIWIVAFIAAYFASRSYKPIGKTYITRMIDCTLNALMSAFAGVFLHPEIGKLIGIQNSEMVITAIIVLTINEIVGTIKQIAKNKDDLLNWLRRK